MRRTDYEATFDIKGGALAARERDALIEWARSQPDGAYSALFEPLVANRSPEANAYYWAHPVDLMAAHTGHSKNACHHWLKALHLPRDLAEQGRNGIVVGEYVIGGSTRKLSKARFFDYVQDCRAWLLDFHGIITKDPDRGWRGRDDEERNEAAA